MICKLQNLSLSNAFTLHPVACCLKAVAFECLPCWRHSFPAIKQKQNKTKKPSMIKNTNYNFLPGVLFEKQIHILKELHVNIQEGTMMLKG